MSSWYAALYLTERWQEGAEKEGEVPECVHLGRGVADREFSGRTRRLLSVYRLGELQSQSSFTLTLAVSLM